MEGGGASTDHGEGSGTAAPGVGTSGPHHGPADPGCCSDGGDPGSRTVRTGSPVSLNEFFDYLLTHEETRDLGSDLVETYYERVEDTLADEDRAEELADTA